MTAYTNLGRAILKVHRVSVLVIAVACLSGCVTVAKTGSAECAESQVLRLERVATITNLRQPESVAADVDKGVIFISNVDAEKDEYYKDDGRSFITRATSGGRVKELRWLDSRPETPINGAKGTCVFGGYLYFSDNTRLLRAPLGKPGKVEVVALPDTQMLNDVATDGMSIYVSDIGQGIVYRVDEKRHSCALKAPPSVNGITFHKGRMFAVSWDLHEIYEVDPLGQRVPEPFNLASHFTKLDGIEVLDDGTFLVSDFAGNKICAVSADRKSVTTLLDIAAPADIGVDLRRHLLFVPQFLENTVVIFRLRRE